MMADTLKIACGGVYDAARRMIWSQSAGKMMDIETL